MGTCRNAREMNQGMPWLAAHGDRRGDQGDRRSADRCFAWGDGLRGPTAAEILGMLTLAVHKRIVLDDLRSTIYAFPTFYGGVREAIGAYVHGVTTVLDPEYAGFRPVEG